MIRGLGRWAWALALALWLPGWGPVVAEAGDPTLVWHTIETEHFLIHYHDGQGDMPERAALYCEQSHAILAPQLEHTPSVKTHVVIDDTVDTANGFANVVPRNEIRIFAYGPEARSTLGDYDDWLRGLILHEYVHILHIDTIGGLPGVVNSVFGKLVAPNQLLPRWYVEGLATYHESKQTGGGRVRSSLFHMYLRSAYLDGTLFSLDRLSATPVDWPRGSAWYLYGSHFLQYITETRGSDWMAGYHAAIGDQIIPWAVNTTLREVLGEDFVGLYQEWTAYLAGRYEAQRLKLQLEGLTPVEALTHEGNLLDGIERRPGGTQLSFYNSDGSHDPGLYTYDVSTGAIAQVVPVDAGAGAHSWDPTGRFVAFHSTRIFKRNYIYNELMLHDTQTGRTRQLTNGGRAREPSFDPTGRKLIFVEVSAGRTHLSSYDLDTGATTMRVLSDGLGQIDYPTWSPDGRFVAFSWWRPDQGRDIYLLEMATGRILQLTHDDALDIEPSFTADGRAVTFSSDRTGIYDIYTAELTGLPPVAAMADPVAWPSGAARVEQAAVPVHRLTRVLRGVFNPVVVEHGGARWLYVNRFDGKGFNLGRMRYDAGGLGSEPAPASREREVVSYPEVSSPILAMHDYEPWRYLQPLSVFPLLAFTNSGRNSYGVELAGFDPVGFHGYQVLAEYFPETSTGFGFGSWSYSRLPVGLQVSGQYSTAERTRGLVQGSAFVPYEEEAWDGQVSLNLPLSDQTHLHNLSIGYNARWTGYLERPAPNHDPADISPREPMQGNFSSLVLGYTLNRADSYANSVSASEGYRLGVTLRLRDKLTGSEVRSVEVRYNGAYFLQNPWLDNHVLALRVVGGIARSDFLRREQFFVGGLPPQEPLSAIINDTYLGGAFLRGFEAYAFGGEQYHIASAEYRFPVWDVEQGFDTLPVHFGRLSGAAYVDAGGAFNGDFADADFHLGAEPEWHVGTGGELRLTTTLGYTLPTSWRLGYAHGFGKTGIDDVYFFVGSTF